MELINFRAPATPIADMVDVRLLDDDSMMATVSLARATYEAMEEAARISGDDPRDYIISLLRDSYSSTMRRSRAERKRMDLSTYARQ
jgi:hypothetical protein